MDIRTFGHRLRLRLAFAKTRRAANKALAVWAKGGMYWQRNAERATSAAAIAAWDEARAAAWASAEAKIALRAVSKARQAVAKAHRKTKRAEAKAQLAKAKLETALETSKAAEKQAEQVWADENKLRQAYLASQEVEEKALFTVAKSPGVSWRQRAESSTVAWASGKGWKAFWEAQQLHADMKSGRRSFLITPEGLQEVR